MKDNKDIIIDGLMARIRELESEKAKQQQRERKHNIENYLLGQFLYNNRNSMLNTFAVFVDNNYEECADSYGYENIEQEVIDLLQDMADGIDVINDATHRVFFQVVGKLQLDKNK